MIPNLPAPWYVGRGRTSSYLLLSAPFANDLLCACARETTRIKDSLDSFGAILDKLHLRASLTSLVLARSTKKRPFPAREDAKQQWRKARRRRPPPRQRRPRRRRSKRVEVGSRFSFFVALESAIWWRFHLEGSKETAARARMCSSMSCFIIGLLHARLVSGHRPLALELSRFISRIRTFRRLDTNISSLPF